MPAAVAAAPAPLRIWQICESYPPKYGGGAGVIVRDIARALTARGNDVRVLTTESGEGDEYSVRTEVREGVRIDRVNLSRLVDLDPDGWSFGLRWWLDHERRIARLLCSSLADWRPDVVQYHTTRPFGEIGPLVIARHGIPVIAMLHEAWFICGRLMLLRSPQRTPCSGPGPAKCLECMYSNYDGTHAKSIAKLTWRIPRLGVYPAYRLARRRAARRALAAGIGYSQFMVRAHPPYLRHTEYLPMGVNLAGVPEALPQRPRTPFRFGFFGGFQPNKGIWHVLDAAAALRRDGLEFELHVWGPAADHDSEAITSRGLSEHVVLHGMYEPDAMWDAYAEVDMAVMATTVSEPLGRIPLEARAAGAPTIAPRIGGLTESIRHERDGLLYDFGDAAQLERAMRRVLAEPRLFTTLSADLEPVLDTRSRGEAIERLYRSIVASEAAA